MRRSDAKKVAAMITNEQIKLMLLTAKEKVKDWSVVSKGNKSFTRGASWNMLGCKDFDVSKKHHILYKINLVREFGEFLPDELKPKKPVKKEIIIHHQDPIF